MNKLFIGSCLVFAALVAGCAGDPLPAATGGSSKQCNLKQQAEIIEGELLGIVEPIAGNEPELEKCKDFLGEVEKIFGKLKPECVEFRDRIEGIVKENWTYWQTEAGCRIKVQRAAKRAALVAAAVGEGDDGAADSSGQCKAGEQAEIVKGKLSEIIPVKVDLFYEPAEACEVFLGKVEKIFGELEPECVAFRDGIEDIVIFDYQYYWQTKEECRGSVKRAAERAALVAAAAAADSSGQCNAGEQAEIMGGELRKIVDPIAYTDPELKKCEDFLEKVEKIFGELKPECVASRDGIEEIVKYDNHAYKQMEKDCRSEVERPSKQPAFVPDHAPPCYTEYEAQLIIEKLIQLQSSVNYLQNNENCKTVLDGAEEIYGQLDAKCARTEIEKIVNDKYEAYRGWLSECKYFMTEEEQTEKELKERLGSFSDPE